jgi:HSP20 family protein
MVLIPTVRGDPANTKGRHGSDERSYQLTVSRTTIGEVREERGGDAMAGLLKRRHEAVEPVETPETVDLFDRTFDEWMATWPFRRPALLARWMPEDLIKVDEFRGNGTLVVRAELPGIDPDKDVELTVTDRMLHIEAERREVEKKGYLRRELRYGSFSRSLPLPEGVTEADVTASCNDGILEIRVPMPLPGPGKKIPVIRA